MASREINEIELLFNTSISEESQKKVGRQLKAILEGAAIGFNEAETKKNLIPIIRMIQMLFDKAEMKFNADELLAMPSREALQKMADMEVGQLQMAFDRALQKSGGIKIDFGNVDLSSMVEPLNELAQELSEIGERIASTTKKSVDDIEQTLNSLRKQKPNKKERKNNETPADTVVRGVEQTLSQLETQSGKETKSHKTAEKYIADLNLYRDAYTASVKNDDPWEVQYQHLLKFVARYETIRKGLRPIIDEANPEFKRLYENLAPKAGAAKISLQHFVDVARGNELSEYKNQPWAREETLKEVKEVLKSGITVKDGGKSHGDKTQQNNSTPPTESVGDNNKSRQLNTTTPPKEVVGIGAEEAARIEAEKKAQAERAAEAARKAMEAEKALAEARKDYVADVYRVIYEPEEPDDRSRKEILESYQAEYWTDSPAIAETYAEMGDNPIMLKGKIVSNKPFIIDAGGHNWDSFGLMRAVEENPEDPSKPIVTDLRDKFPELFKRIDAGEFGSDPANIQVELNKAIKALGEGFDTVITRRVKDGLNPDDFRETSTTYAVLDDAVLHVKGAIVGESDEEGFYDFDGKAKKEDIPEYYKMPERPAVEDAPPLVEKVEIKENIEAETAAHKENTEAIITETQAHDALNAKKAETQQIVATDEPPVAPETQVKTNDVEIDSNRQKAISYDELRQKVEAYLQARKLMSDGETPMNEAVAQIDVARKAITSLFPEKGKSPTDVFTSAGVGNMLSNSSIYEEHVRSLARALGIEIPQAAQQAEQTVGGLNNELQIVGNNADNIDVKIDDNLAPNASVGQGAESLENVRAKVAEVTAAVDAKTQAFKNEANAVDQIVDSEVKKLTELENKITTIKTTLEGLLNNIKSGTDNIGAGLSNITINVNSQASTEGDLKSPAGAEDLKSVLDAITRGIETIQNTEKTDNKDAINAITLETTLTKVFSGILTPQQSKLTDQGVAGGTQAVLEKINTSLAKMHTLMLDPVKESGLNVKFSGIKQSLDSINGKLVPNTRVGGYPMGSAAGSGVVGPQGKLLDAKIQTQFASLSLLYTQLESNGKLTEDIESKWAHLWDSLNDVKDRAGLQLWQQELAQVKKAINEIIIANNLVAQESESSFRELINITKLYNQMMVGAAKASTPELQRFYTEEANQLLVEQQRLLGNIILSKEQQIKLDELAEARQRELNKIQAEKQGKSNKQSDTERQKQIEALIRLYRELGQLQARDVVENTETSNIRVKLKQDEIQEQERLLTLTSNEIELLNQERSAAVDTELALLDAKESDILAEKNRKQIIRELIGLYKELGAAKAINNTDEVSRLGSEITSRRGRLSSITGGEENSFTEARDKAYFDRRKAEFTKVQKLYQELGQLQARYDQEGSAQVKQRIDQIYDEIDAIDDLIKLTQQEVTALEDLAAAAMKTESANLGAKVQDKDWKAKVKAIQRETGINAATSVANAANDTVLRAIGINDISQEFEQKAQELATRVSDLQKLRDVIAAKGEKADESDKKLLSEQIAKVKELKTEVNGYLAIHEKYSDAEDLGDASNFGVVGTDEYWNNITAAIQASSKGKVVIKGLNADTGELTGTTKIAANTFATWSATVDPITGRLSMLRTGIKKTETLVESITRKTKEIFTYFSGSSIIFKFFNEFKRGIQYVREIDLAMTELKKVTDETEETYDEFLKTAAKTADKVGSTIQKVVSSTADWARLNI